MIANNHHNSTYSQPNIERLHRQFHPQPQGDRYNGAGYNRSISPFFCNTARVKNSKSQRQKYPTAPHGHRKKIPEKHLGIQIANSNQTGCSHYSQYHQTQGIKRFFATAQVNAAANNISSQHSAYTKGQASYGANKA